MKSGLSRTDARARLGLSAEDPVFGCVARLHESKGVQYLPAIARELIRTLPSAKILVAGDGPLRNGLERDIRGAGLSESLRLLGWREDVPDLLAALDAFFLPSVEESFPRTILEALAAGCPVVATDVGGVGEIISDGQHGVLVPPGDPVAMCRQLIFTYEHRDEACRMAARGQSRVTTEFTLEHMLAQTQALYDELKARKNLS
jgi:glycosyltransferase involved in cell wall biosynthesis